MAGPPTVILGAGLAGLSVARALLRERPGGPIVLVDRRTSWERDRTWCFWATPGLPDAELATARWTAWRTVGPGGEAVQRSERHPYLHVPADRFYDAALAELEAAPEVELVDGTRVLAVREVTGGRAVEVETTAGTLSGAIAVDAMGGNGPLLSGRPRGAVEQRQRFLGLEVEVARPVFDPGVATLMDFRLPAVPGGVRFAYVLPFSRTRALVEDTTIGGPILTDAHRRAALDRLLRDTLGAGDVTVLREERGVLPMTTFRFPAARGRRIVAAGQAAGAARPSSGYAFARTQRHATALARAIVRDETAPSAEGPARRRALDALFLRALVAAPHLAPAWFDALARRVPADVFARFMSDASSPADEARIVSALASIRFVTAMAGGGRRLLRGDLHSTEPSAPPTVAA